MLCIHNKDIHVCLLHMHGVGCDGFESLYLIALHQFNHGEWSKIGQNKSTLMA